MGFLQSLGHALNPMTAMRMTGKAMGAMPGAQSLAKLPGMGMAAKMTPGFNPQQPQQPTGGLGPSMAAMGGMKPPPSPMGQPMQQGEMNQPPPFMKPGVQMDQPPIGPSMDAMQGMMQQPQVGQAPEAMGQQPDFSRMPPQDRMKAY